LLCLFSLIFSHPEQAKYVHFTGHEQLAMGQYGTSVPLPLLPADAMLAFEMNGERLLPDHGFPLRVILPGFGGGWRIFGSMSLSTLLLFFILFSFRVF
jgi:hypothetical protein